ncbi:MAG: hypothetical protein CMH53_02375, partial [Myxococcales bacterium]|nr:hypothetical protein [Myxococcales bacterium]
SPKRKPTLKRKKQRRKRKLSARKIGKKMRFGGVPCVTWALLADGRETSKVCIAKPKALGLSKVEWQTIERGMNRVSKQILKMGEALSKGAGMAPNPMRGRTSRRQMSKFVLMMQVTGGWPIARKRGRRAGAVGRPGIRPRASQWQQAQGQAPQIDQIKRAPSYFKPPKGYLVSRNFGR